MRAQRWFSVIHWHALRRSVAEGEALSGPTDTASAAEESQSAADKAPQEPAQEPIAPAEVDEARQALARRYARQRQTLSLINLAISAVVIVALLFTGLNFGLRDALGGVSAWSPVWGWQPLKIAAYFGVLFALSFILGLPLGYYGGYTLPRRYGLSIQTLRGWLVDQAKELALSLAFELVAVEALYALLAAAPLTWWLWAGALVLVVTVVLANLLPVLILPLFYKLTPLPEGEVRERALALAQRAHTHVRGIYSINMSVRTTTTNAMVIGLGNTRRIVVGDTLLDRYTPDEIEVVVAHELGHQVHHDIPKLIATQTLITLGGLYVVNVALHGVVGAVHAYHGLNDSATMPLIAAALGVFGLVTLPLVNGFSRRVEHQADIYALESTGKVDAFISAMTRLANQNLAELNPSPLVEFLLYNHPSIGKRLAFAQRYAETRRT
ncbi:MAG TPA: M48 family metallopeptidase [Ktedonobacterales bacterium]|nr:M48 family metallopeptidase [Ktedonobacterales bacterium]